MSIITLTTDFGVKDHFVGAVKGRIYKELESATIVDISHLVSPFNIQEGAYILKNAYKNFPDGTIHIIGIDSELTPENKHMVVFLDNHYFISADNGIISLIVSQISPPKIVEITRCDLSNSNFPVLDVFVKAACHIARGGNPEDLGIVTLQYKEIREFVPVVNTPKTKITGHVIYIDTYGNVITNITRRLFDTIRKGRHYELSARNYIFHTIYDRYSDTVNFTIEKHRRDDDGKKRALFNSGGYLELAIYRSNLDTVGGASTLLGLSYRDTVTVEFS